MLAKPSLMHEPVIYIRCRFWQTTFKTIIHIYKNDL
ncbi:hypothetical protein SAMN05720382_101694 [Polaromonas sp. JS666]|nr:hypothetical protein SAMN05720382_101694 [Polaromonas sp. JS666]